MSMLQRFRKPGGFLQLLTLIETCDASKQKNLLNLVGAEDPGWAHLVKVKSLTFERIMSWPVEVLMEVTPHLPDRVLASVYQMALILPHGVEMQDKWLQSLPSVKAKEIKSLADSAAVSGSENQAAVIKMIQTVRELSAKGQIQFQKFDPGLELDQRIAA